jgi:hypothetical protein
MANEAKNHAANPKPQIRTIIHFRSGPLIHFFRETDPDHKNYLYSFGFINLNKQPCPTRQ